MDASTIAILPAFVVAMLETADEIHEQTPVGGEPGEHVSVLARLGATVITLASHQEDLRWSTFDSVDEAAAVFATERDRADALVAYSVSPEYDERVLMVVSQRGVPLEAAIQLVRQFDAMRAIADKLSEQESVEQPVRAIGRAPVPTGTTYVGSNQVDVYPNTGMYL